MFYVTISAWKFLIDALAHGGWPAMYGFFIVTPFTLIPDLIYATYRLIKNIILTTHQIETEATISAWKKSQRAAWINAVAETFAPLAGLSKNIFETFRPYKYNASTEFMRILQQPVVGLANVLSGLYRAISAPLIGTIHTAALLLSLLGRPSHYKQVFSKLSHVIPNMITRTINGTGRIIAGVAQLALTPFSWFVKPIIRTAITLVSDTQLMENNDGIKARLEAVKTMTDKHDRISTYTDIHRKLIKCMTRAQSTKLDKTGEQDLFNNVSDELYNNDQSISDNETSYNNFLTHGTIFIRSNNNLIVPNQKSAEAAPLVVEGEPETCDDNEPGSTIYDGPGYH
jgi:hypothetical protein